MIKVLLIGHGRMGQLIEKTIAADPEMEVTGIIDIDNTDDLFTLDKIADIIIDFSSPAIFPLLSEYIKRTGTALLSGTTGYDENHFEQLRQLGQYAPVMHSANYSLGVAVFKRVLESISSLLYDEGFDIEVTEAHHNQKVDAPSGTAKLLVEAIDPQHNCQRVYGREGFTGIRPHNEIGVHAIRGGSVAGEHTVSFFGQDETFEITHRATSRQIFVNGAVMAAKRLYNAQPGYYTLQQLLFPEN